MKLTVKRYENSASGELFDIVITPDRGPRPDCLRSPPGSKERGRDSISRSISTIKEIGLANDWDYFVTFTFRDGSVPDLMNYDYMADQIGRRFRHIREDFPGFSCGYLIIPEIHPEKRQRIHFHGFVRDLPPDIFFRNDNGYLSLKPFHDSFGFVSLSPVGNTQAVVFYCLKYVCKDIAVLRKNDHSHLYYRSRGLKKFEVVKNEFYSGSKRLLFDGGFNYNQDYDFFSLKGLTPKVAAAVLEYIQDQFLIMAYSEKEVYIDGKFSSEVFRDLYAGGEGKQGNEKEVLLFDD